MAEIIVGSVTLALIVLFTVFTQIPIKCPMCGKGRIVKKRCDICNGLGSIPGTGTSHVSGLAHCRVCNGSGEIEVCAFCIDKKQVSLLNWISIKLAKKKLVQF